MIRLVSFEALGHEARAYNMPGTLFGKTFCVKCSCFDGSATGNFPCGVPHVNRVASIRESRHAWDFFWNGKVIGYAYVNT